MERDLIDAKFNTLFRKLRDLRRTEGREIIFLTLAAAALGYWALGSAGGAALSGFFGWLIRTIPNSIKSDRIGAELSQLTLEFPEEAKDAIERQKLERQFFG